MTQAKIKVLIVDDSKTVRRAIETILTRWGCEIYVAGDGFQAFSTIVKYQPDMIFLDIMMPKLNGYEVCAVIKNNPIFSHIPIILLSGRSDILDRARGRLVGADQFMGKPFSEADLTKIIQQYAPL